MKNFVTARFLFRITLFLLGVAMPSGFSFVHDSAVRGCKLGNELLSSECVLRILVIDLIFARHRATGIFK